MAQRARKRFGQHFLIKRGAIERIVRALGVSEGDPLLEIGPGRGALTTPLLERAGRMAVVELDRDLAAQLIDRYGEEKLLLFQEDILGLPLSLVLEGLQAGSAQRLILAGNLPYNISKPIAMKLVREREQIDRAVLMFQTEVARRLTAAPGSREYGPLTVLTGRVYEITRLFDLPGSAFRPRPKVDSTVTLWHRIEGQQFSQDDELRLRGCLAACFAQRRKTLANNLRSALGDATRAEALLATAGLDGRQRAEQLPPEDYFRLAGFWSPATNESNS